LSGVIWVGWRNECLFIAVDVVDDKFVQNMTGKDLWKGDHIEIFIDTKWTPEVKGTFGEGQFQIGISPGNLQNTGDILLDIPPEYYIWRPSNIKIKEDIKVAALKTETGYSIECAIPFKNLNIQPKEEMIIGIDICISDTDNPNIQEKMTSLIKSQWQLAERSRLKPLKFVGAFK
ncbi:MAG: hypothetical protein NC922_07720, partial [Candidatus Omnitrophica bacterium]|nr:hypothetical protein [Candidatus Omnitrophota bacterium]